MQIPVYRYQRSKDFVKVLYNKGSGQVTKKSRAKVTHGIGNIHRWNMEKSC